MSGSSRTSLLKIVRIFKNKFTQDCQDLQEHIYSILSGSSRTYLLNIVRIFKNKFTQDCQDLFKNMFTPAPPALIRSTFAIFVSAVLFYPPPPHTDYLFTIWLSSKQAKDNIILTYWWLISDNLSTCYERSQVSSSILYKLIFFLILIRDLVSF